MAKRLEDSLYRNAKSFKEYKDHATLRHRLQQLAARLGTNAQQNRAKVRLQSHDVFFLIVGERSLYRVSYDMIVHGLTPVHGMMGYHFCSLVGFSLSVVCNSQLGLPFGQCNRSWGGDWTDVVCLRAIIRY